MKKTKILHILSPDRFTVGFVKFIRDEFNPNDHLFLWATKPEDAVLDSSRNSSFLYATHKKNPITNVWIFYKSSRKVSKIILHGNPVLHYFLLFPWLLKKTFWVIYGYELGTPELPEKKSISDYYHSYVKRFVLKRISGHITHINGDSELANLRFKSSANFYYSPMYLSNVVPDDKPENLPEIKKSKIKKILVGNSTSPTNNHSSIFQMLLPYKNDDILIYSPLSYGVFTEYRDEVIKEGSLLFGEKFIPITNYMTLEEYNSFLKDIDIAIFNHNRQEAMGVTLSLISKGKIVYLNRNTTSYCSLTERGIKVFDNALIKRDGLFKERDTSINFDLVYKEYSYEMLKSSLQKIFYE